jgi:hypothetical protein
MGGNHGKQRTSFRKVLRIRSHRPVSFAGIDDQVHYRERHIPARPLSMYDVVPLSHLEISKIN